jgi:hypothetical protein
VLTDSGLLFISALVNAVHDSPALARRALTVGRSGQSSSGSAHLLPYTHPTIFPSDFASPTSRTCLEFVNPFHHFFHSVPFFPALQQYQACFMNFELSFPLNACANDGELARSYLV